MDEQADYVIHIYKRKTGDCRCSCRRRSLSYKLKTNIMQKKEVGFFFFPTSSPVAAHAANRFSSSQHLSNFLKLKDVTLTIFYLTNTVITYRVIPEEL